MVLETTDAALNESQVLLISMLVDWQTSITLLWYELGGQGWVGSYTRVRGVV